VRFSESEINTAMKMRAAGLNWKAEPGQYVFDINGLMHAGSPFQAGVFLIHSTNTFEVMVGGVDELIENFVWLPTWEDCRSWLKNESVSDDRVIGAWQSGEVQGLSDRQVLYELMLTILEGSTAAE
jgi:hypothetical protein|tara:strand:- start:942 stop:1319 length:378 start_codon:yes stop_codon:yes gene_type:complete